MSHQTPPLRDRFVDDRLPPVHLWPEMLPLPSLSQASALNCTSLLLDRHLTGAAARRPAIASNDRIWTYEELGERVARIANLMSAGLGVMPGSRVLIRGANAPEVAAIWLAAQKLGAVAVTTMSLLRTAELRVIIEMSQPIVAFCDETLATELEDAVTASGQPLRIVRYGADDGELYRLMSAHRATAPPSTAATRADDIAIVAFTSGTTGRPKATIHFQRDIIAICDTVSAHMIAPTPADIFIGTAPLAFTFGLGGLLAFPLYAGACTVLNARYSPQSLVEAIARHRATVCFTVPTFYQQMLKLPSVTDLPSLRLAVSSGEALPLPVREAWHAATGLQLTEVLGSTEMLHAFVGATGPDVRPGFIGRAIPGYRIAVLDDNANPLPPGSIGRMAVKGPTGCRYMDDARQTNYVQNGWNLTGDACSMTEDGYVAYHTRYDDLIISAGYNISGEEVENALLLHPEVAECAVVGEPDAERGHVVVAHVVAFDPSADLNDLAGRLQEHVKRTIAPYKYPRIVRFTDHLPRNESGKIQRFRLRA